MLGGEKSAFHMVVSEYIGTESPFNENSEFYERLYQRPHSSLNKLVCISDCIARDELTEHVAFMSNTMIDFRNSRSKVVSTSNYNRIDKKYENTQSRYDSPVRSNKYQLLKRGTVLWVSDSHFTDVLSLIEKDQHHAIGYNYIKIIKKL